MLHHEQSSRVCLCHAVHFDADRCAELHVLRLLLMEKFGRAFSAAVMDNSNNSVSERVRFLLVHPKLADAQVCFAIDCQETGHLDTCAGPGRWLHDRDCQGIRCGLERCN